MLEIVLLGCGATMPAPDRALSAAVLRCAGRGILFDCGEGTQSALRREKLSPVKLDLIALSHYHGDHIFGLPGLLQTMGCLNRTEPLYLAGPEGLQRVAALMLALSGPLPYPVRLLPLGAGESLPLRSLHPAWPAGAALSAFATEHRVESLGYRFTLPRPGRFQPERAKALGIPVQLWGRLQRQPEEAITLEGREIFGRDLLGPERRGLCLVFSGDTRPCDALREAARGADLLIHDATYPDDSQAEEAALWGHSSFLQAAALAREAGVRRLWLTHYSQALRQPENYLDGARAIFPNTECGRDGLRLSLRFEEDTKPEGGSHGI